MRWTWNGYVLTPASTDRSAHMICTPKRVVAVLVVGLGVVATACGADRPGAASDDTSFAGNRNGAGGDALVGPCTTEGETVACHVETGRVGDIVNCFSGKQICVNGEWSPCGGADGTLTAMTVPPLHLSGGLGTLATTTTCTANPCAANCLSANETPAVVLTAGMAASTDAVFGVVSTPSSFPGGTTAAKAQAMCGIDVTKSCLASSDKNTSPQPDDFRCDPVPAGFAGTGQTLWCGGYDYCCASISAPHAAGTVSNTCQPWAAAGGSNPNSATCVKPAGVDFQLGMGCASPDGHIHMPVCNRGLTAVTLNAANPLRVAFAGANPNNVYNSGSTAGVCNPPAPGASYCKIQNGKTLNPGKCMDLDFTAASQIDTTAPVYCTTTPTGNAVFLVNPPTVAGAGGYAHIAEAAGTASCNNYSFVPSSLPAGAACVSNYGEPQTANFAYSYSAACPPGSAITWNQFAYNTNWPAGSAGSTIKFTLATTGAPTVVATSTNTAAQPALCPMSSVTAPCPYSLATLPSAPALTLAINITTAGSTSPTVNSWNISYICTPNE